MSVYNKNGNALLSVYGKNGSALTHAYDKDGDLVYTSGGVAVRVMNYNVGQYYIGNGSPIPTASKSIYSALQTTIFNNQHPDICVMQEATDQFCADGTLADTFLSSWFDTFETTRGSIGYQAHKIATDGYEISNYTAVPFTNAVGNYPGYETCTITIGNKEVFFVNTHMSTTQSYQEAQCAEILAAVANKERFVVCGDFNTVIESLSDTDYITCIKPFIDEGYADANCGSFGIFPTYYATADPNADYKPATDHIIVSSNIVIANAYVDTTKLTDGIDEKIDHVPLIADLIIY